MKAIIRRCESYEGLHKQTSFKVWKLVEGQKIFPNDNSVLCELTGDQITQLRNTNGGHISGLRLNYPNDIPEIVPN